MKDDAENSCTECGACCAGYRVSFYWAEAEAWGLSHAITEKLTPFLCCMAGTNRHSPRCFALRGEIGQTVTCAVYEHRPSLCRNLQPGDDKCIRARGRHGLPPLGH